MINWKIPTSPSESGAAAIASAPPGSRKKIRSCSELPDLQLRGCFLELLVFDQLPNQIPARIILVRIFLRRLLIDRKQAAALQVNQIRRHDDEFARDIDVQFLECLEIFEVLAGDPFERDLVNVDLVPLDQIKQQIERTFENLELDLVIASMWRREILGTQLLKVNRGRLSAASSASATLRWTQTLFTIPRPNMIMRTNEPL